MKFLTLVSCSSFYFSPKCIQFIAKTKELALLFQYMVNGPHLYSAFIQSTLQFMPLIHPFTQQQRLAAIPTSSSGAIGG